MKNKFKNLTIISDCVHAFDANGNVGTENHIFCRQMEVLAAHFEHTIICCPFVNTSFDNISPYLSAKVDFIQLPNVGGNSLKDKLKIVRTIPVWIKAFGKALKDADIVYLRMPNNLSIPGFFYFCLRFARMFSTYTGTWKNYKGEPVTYRFQKWILKYLFKGPVWVYTNEECKHKRLFKNFSPSYGLQEWEEENEQVRERIRQYSSKLITTPVFITVGSLVSYKNQQYILEVCKRLREKNFPFYWYIVGDGPLKEDYIKFVKENKLNSCVCITGKKSYHELRELYRKANFLVQSTLIEGFGKTPVEAMFHGVIPLLSSVAMANEMTGNGIRGYVYTTDDPKNLECLIYRLQKEQNKFANLIENARKYAKEQTLENWAESYLQTINNFFKKRK